MSQKSIKGGILTPVWRKPKAASPEAPTPSAAPSVAPSVEAVAPEGVIALRFGYQNLAASLSAQLYVSWPGAAVSVAQAGEPMIFAGHILGMSLRASEALTAGQATFEPYVEGTASGAQLLWSSSNRATASFAPNTYTFSASDEVDVRVSTSSTFAPTTTDLGLLLICSYLPSGV